MMHRDTGVTDEFEELCSIPVLKAKRLRMRRNLEVSGLEAPGSESVVIPLMGSIKVEVSGSELAALNEKDVCYLSSGTRFSVQAREGADFIWAEAPAEKVFASYVKRFADIRPVFSGADGYRRSIFTSIGEKDPANRFIVGFVEGNSGNWTSFPPHRHDGKPEVYVYYGMRKKFGVQVVAGKNDKAYIVRDGDAVLFEEGYHPNVATPGVGMNFVWIISADPKDRNLSVELHPEYKDMPMGETHLTTK